MLRQSYRTRNNYPCSTKARITAARKPGRAASKSSPLLSKAGDQAANGRKEFASLDDDSNIYKLVGPVLLKQEKSEAVMAVDGRLEFIEKEMFVILFPFY